MTIACRIPLNRLAGLLLQASLFALGSAAYAADIHLSSDHDLQEAIDQANPGDHIHLSPGTYAGNFVIDKPLTLSGPKDRSAVVHGPGKGRPIWVKAPGVTVQQLTVRGSGMSLFDMDAAIFLDKEADSAVVRHNDILDNLIGVYVWGPQNARVLENRVVGNQTLRRNERGNGVQLWNTPGSEVVGNDIRSGRDGIYVNASKHNSFRDNEFRDVRFSVHYMFTQDSEVRGNVSYNNEIGYAMMYSERLIIEDNIALGSDDHGLLLNSVNRSTIRGNQVIGAEKCLFYYSANINVVQDNRFEQCDIGVHFTAGSEQNTLNNNAFINNQTQVMYVGTRHLDWSEDGTGNYWSDNTAFDLDGDGIADTAYRPNNVMDQVLWRAPMAKLLLNSPATQVIKWAQSQFPAIHPGGIVDSAPLMQPPSSTRSRYPESP